MGSMGKVGFDMQEWCLMYQLQASWMSIPTAPMYSASKHAVLGFARSVAATVKRNNIRVNVIHPFFSGKSLNLLPASDREP
jgi:NAD(P)-dependent dehydrogenase (short-subunit alcohol dehydrogenase family)